MRRARTRRAREVVRISGERERGEEGRGPWPQKGERKREEAAVCGGEKERENKGIRDFLLSFTETFGRHTEREGSCSYHQSRSKAEPYDGLTGGDETEPVISSPILRVIRSRGVVNRESCQV